MGKILENSYRSTNIAFIEEWSRFAEEAGVGLYAMVNAIRARKTHSNLMYPGIGVGGYCLTKDPAFAPAAARQLFGNRDLTFPFSELAMRVNNDMPAHTVRRLEIQFGGSCRGKRILLLGMGQ